MDDIIAKLKKLQNLDVVEKTEGWVIHLARPEGIMFEILILRNFLEWFASAKAEATGKKVWTDWMDYYSADGETEKKLRSQMKKDILRFVERLRLSTVRVVESKVFFRKRQRLEWKMDADWEKLLIYF
jgi:hypothetical protein